MHLPEWILMWLLRGFGNNKVGRPGRSQDSLPPPYRHAWMVFANRSTAHGNSSIAPFLSFSGWLSRLACQTW